MTKDIREIDVILNRLKPDTLAEISQFLDSIAEDKDAYQAVSLRTIAGRAYRKGIEKSSREGMAEFYAR